MFSYAVASKVRSGGGGGGAGVGVGVGSGPQSISHGNLIIPWGPVGDITGFTFWAVAVIEIIKTKMTACT